MQPTKYSVSSNLHRKINKLILFVISIILFAFIYYYYCDYDDFYSSIKLKGDDCGLQPMNNWYDAISFSTIVQSTVGYGDISPKKNSAKIIVIIQVMISFIILLL
jgi:hypothetical protein